LKKREQNAQPTLCKENRQISLAALTALALLIVTGTGYRILAYHLARPTQSVPLPPGTLAKLPLKIGGWIGKDVPLDPAIIRATDTDDHINRVYYRNGRTERVGVFIAYGVRARDLMPHRPEVCYPGGGWNLIKSQVTSIALTRQKDSLSYSLFKFARGGLDSRSVSVVNYYIVDGQYCPDVSLLRSRIWRGAKGAHYIAQVQISCAGDQLYSVDSSEKSLRDFARDSAHAIRSLLPPLVIDN